MSCVAQPMCNRCGDFRPQGPSITTPHADQALPTSSQVLSAVWRAADTGGTNDLSQGRVERALKLLRLYQDTGDVDLNAADDIDAMDGLDPPVFEEGYDPWEDSASSVRFGLEE